MSKKRSILLYFDNFRRVADLPDDQLGILFRALMECGEAEADGRDGITGFEQRYPNMDGNTRMAFSFMADTIRRDAAAYAARCGRSPVQRRREPLEEQRHPPCLPGSEQEDKLSALVHRMREEQKKTGQPDNWTVL